MKMISFVTILMTGAALIGCGDAAPKSRESPGSGDNECGPAATEAQQSDAISPLYKDGINDANRGDKRAWCACTEPSTNQPAARSHCTKPRAETPSKSPKPAFQTVV